MSSHGPLHTSFLSAPSTELPLQNVTSLRCFSLQPTLQLLHFGFYSFFTISEFCFRLSLWVFPSPILLIHDFQDENYIWSNPLLILEAGKIALKLLNVSNEENGVKRLTMVWWRRRNLYIFSEMCLEYHL